MPGNAEVKGMCRYTGEEHPVAHDADSPQGRVLVLDLKENGFGHCAGHDTYSVTKVPAQPEINTAS